MNMKTIPMKSVLLRTSLALAPLLASADTEYLLNGNFEATPWDSGWTNQTSGADAAAIESAGLVAGSTSSAFMTGLGNTLALQQTFTETAGGAFTFMADIAASEGGARIWLDYDGGSIYLRLQTQTGQGSIQALMSGSWATIGTGRAFDYSAVDESGTGFDSPFVYRLSIMGHGFGTEDAAYDFSLYSYSTDTIVSSADNVTRFENSAPVGAGVSGITSFGISQNGSYHTGIDNVSLTAIPESSSTALLAGFVVLCGGCLYRRFRS